ncbi:hypothetical protein BDW67DRAFT_97090 [Aspergillus spinulosporus]
MSSDDSDCISGSENCHFSCPSGGTWYVCPEAPYFVGCCSSDPCTNTDSNSTNPCPDVYAASFDGSIYDSIRPNTCIGESNDNWYTCNFTQPRFLGCCSINPCANGTCPQENVLPAAWSQSRGDQYKLFLDEESTTDESDGGLSGGAIAGIVIGAVAALVLLLAAFWFWRRKRRGADGKGGYTPGHGTGPASEGEYGYQHPTSPYQDSHFSSPGQTTISAGAKYPSGSTFSPSLSPPLPSESGRPISEISGSDEHFRQSGPNHGLGVFAKPDPIPELDSAAKPPEVHELDGLSRS